MALIDVREPLVRIVVRQAVIFVIVYTFFNSICDATPVSRAIESYLRRFVASNNFSGSVLVTQRSTVVEENSGLPDANDLPNYDALLGDHQTAGSLVQQIRGLRPLGNPGGRHTHEEHSAYNVLALIVERQTGLTFAQAMQKEIFGPERPTALDPADPALHRSATFVAFRKLKTPLSGDSSKRTAPRNMHENFVQIRCSGLLCATQWHTFWRHS